MCFIHVFPVCHYKYPMNGTRSLFDGLCGKYRLDTEMRL